MNRVCGYCGENIDLDPSAIQPENCPRCGTPFEDKAIPENENKLDSDRRQRSTNVTGVVLTSCRDSANKIMFRSKEKILIGRELFNEKLPGVGKISRLEKGGHCMIEYTDGCFYVTDLNSTNGTFLGIDKIDCKRYPRQPIEDDDILFLGAEPFSIRFEYHEIRSSENIGAQIPKSNKFEKKDNERIYSCQNCGWESAEKLDSCPNCNAYGTIK